MFECMLKTQKTCCWITAWYKCIHFSFYQSESNQHNIRKIKLYRTRFRKYENPELLLVWMSWFGTGVSWFDSGGSCCRTGDLNSVFKIEVVQFYDMHRHGLFLLGCWCTIREACRTFRQDKIILSHTVPELWTRT